MALTTSSSIQFKPSLHHLPLPSMPNTPSFKQSNNPSKLAFSSSSIRRSFHRLSRSLEVSASAVAVQTEKDKSPLDGVRVTETAEPQSRVRLSVEVPPVVCQDCYKRVLEEFSKRTKIPGFRPGKKVPENILINYVGKEYVRRATIESILKRTLPHAMASVEGRALKDSVRVVTKFSKMNEEFSLQDIFRFDVMVDVSPEIKWLSESRYKNLKVVVEIDNSINAQSASEEELRRRHKALGSLRIVTDRGLEVGDVVVIDIHATTTGESGGQRIPSAETKGFHFDTEESDNLLPGFLNSIIGIRPGETKSFPLSFPESWKQENLRGVSAQFTVECRELFYRQLPELDDAIADKLLPGSSTLAQVQEVILQRCKEVEKSAIDQATDNAILDQLSKIVEVPAIPQSLFEEQGRQLYGAQLLELQVKQKLNEQQIATLSSEKAVNEFLEFQRENITNIIKQMLAVGEIFRCENLQYPMDELVKEVQNSVAEFKRNNQEYDEDRVREQVQDVMEGAKVLEWLRENSQIQYVYR